MRNLDLLYTKGKAERASVYLPDSWFNPVNTKAGIGTPTEMIEAIFRDEERALQGSVLAAGRSKAAKQHCACASDEGKDFWTKSFTQRLGQQGKGGMLGISFLCHPADSSALQPMVGVCLNKTQKGKSRHHSSSLLTTTMKSHGTLNLLLPSCPQAGGRGWGRLCLRLWPTTVREYHTEYR